MSQPVSIERQVTHQPCGHILTNTGVWSPDGQWILYDTRSDPAGEKFDGDTIEMVHLRTGEVKVLYRSKCGARCGVATFHPRQPKAVFILGPENPTADWQYGACHRQGVIVDADPARSNTAASGVLNLDARDLVVPFTPGALRGGSHVHVWDPAGEWVSFTYEDHVLARFKEPGPDHDINQRNVGISASVRSVSVPKSHPRNHDAGYFSVLATRTTAEPKPGSDEIKKACEEGWIGTNGYLRSDGSRQRHALAFQGQVVAITGQTITELFIVDLPEDITVPGDGPLGGTDKRLPSPPKGTVQRRFTHTEGRRFPGLQGPRHWIRSSPDGSRIAFLMKDDAGVVQLWSISPNGGAPTQITRNAASIASTFTWSPDGRRIAHVMENRVCVTDVFSGRTTPLTSLCRAEWAPRPEACVFSPDGRRIAYVRPVKTGEGIWNQIFAVEVRE